MVRLGKENPWLKIADVHARNFVRSRYYLDWKTGEFITDYKDAKDFEKYLVRIVYIIALILLGNKAKWANLKFLCLKEDELKAISTAGPSSQGSTEPWDTPFNRATNKYKNRDLDKPLMSGVRVSSFGTSMKLSEYYCGALSLVRHRNLNSVAHGLVRHRNLIFVAKFLWRTAHTP